jgi:cobyrinic acid a,c-diamide synthase
MYLARSIEWPQHGKTEKSTMVGSIDADIIMEKRPQGRGYVQLQETDDHPWTGADNIPVNNQPISAHEFHYSRFKSIAKDVKFAFQVKRGTGIDGQSDGYTNCSDTER